MSKLVCILEKDIPETRSWEILFTGSTTDDKETREDGEGNDGNGTSDEANTWKRCVRFDVQQTLPSKGKIQCQSILLRELSTSIQIIFKVALAHSPIPTTCPVGADESDDRLVARGKSEMAAEAGGFDIIVVV